MFSHDSARRGRSRPSVHVLNWERGTYSFAPPHPIATLPPMTGRVAAATPLRPIATLPPIAGRVAAATPPRGARGQAGMRDGACHRNVDLPACLPGRRLRQCSGLRRRGRGRDRCRCAGGRASAAIGAGAEARPRNESALLTEVCPVLGNRSVSCRRLTVAMDSSMRSYHLTSLQEALQHAQSLGPFCCKKHHEPFDCRRFLVRHDMGVHAELNARVAVVTPRRHRFNACAGREIERSVDVPKIGQPHPRHCRTRDGLLEGAAHVAWRECRPKTDRELEFAES